MCYQFRSRTPGGRGATSRADVARPLRACSATRASVARAAMREYDGGDDRTTPPPNRSVVVGKSIACQEVKHVARWSAFTPALLGREVTRRRNAWRSIHHIIRRPEAGAQLARPADGQLGSGDVAAPARTSTGAPTHVHARALAAGCGLRRAARTQAWLHALHTCAPTCMLC